MPYEAGLFSQPVNAVERIGEPKKSGRPSAYLMLFTLGILGSLFYGGSEAKMQTKQPQYTEIRCGQIIDGKSDASFGPAYILIENDRIKRVGSLPSTYQNANIIDLGRSTCLPGLVDSHTHVLLQGDISSDDYDSQLLKESIPYRTIRATKAVQTAVMNGFTAIRDLETEGAMFADVDLKKAINDGIVPGPRMFVATRALAPTGMYPLVGYSWELKVPKGVQIVDGADEIRRAVREQVENGADWIKFYADRRYFMQGGRLHSWVNFTDEEASTIVNESHRLGHKVAAHAIGWDGIDAALKAGVDSVEHGSGLTEDLMDRMIKQNVYWCPTLFVLDYVKERGGIWTQIPDISHAAFERASNKDVKIIYGTDAGGYSWEINQAVEFSYMTKYGMPPMKAIKSSTSVASELLGVQDQIGTIETGKFADIIAVGGDPLKDITILEHVGFVMKNGKVIKYNPATGK